MNWVKLLGAFHGFLGTSLLFLSLHPLRDALDTHSLELLRVGSALQATLAIAVMYFASLSIFEWGARVIAVGTTLWTAMLYWIIFTGTHPFDLMVPIGGVVMMIGWLMILVAAARKISPPQTEKE